MADVRKTLPIVNLLLALLQIPVAVYTQLEQFGPSIGQISDRYPTYVVPAGYAFSIWSLIFGLSIAFALWSSFPGRRDHTLVRQIHPYSAGAFFFTSTWMLVFREGFYLPSVAIMIGLLVCLIVISIHITCSRIQQNGLEQVLISGTFGIFLGWISVATVANVAQTLLALGVQTSDEVAMLWAIALLIIVGVVAGFLTLRLRNGIPFSLTVVWALLATAIARYQADVNSVANVAATIGGLLVCLVLFRLLRGNNYLRRSVSTR